MLKKIQTFFIQTSWLFSCSQLHYVNMIPTLPLVYFAEGLFDQYISQQDYKPVWTPIQSVSNSSKFNTYSQFGWHVELKPSYTVLSRPK